MKRLFGLVVILALAVVISTPAQAQTSNILIVSQDAGTKVITVIQATDNGVVGSWLSYSGQLSTTGTAIENKLFTGLAAGKVLVVRIDATKTMTVLVADDPHLTGYFVVIDDTLVTVVSAIKNTLYLGL